MRGGSGTKGGDAHPLPGTNGRVSGAACLGRALLRAHMLPAVHPDMAADPALLAPQLSRSPDVCSEKAWMFAASAPRSLDANVAGLPSTHINPDTHKLL